MNTVVIKQGSLPENAVKGFTRLSRKIHRTREKRWFATLIALYADRALVRRLRRLAATLAYAAVYLVSDHVLALTPLGSGMSASVTQMGMPAVASLASLARTRRIAVVASSVLVASYAFEHSGSEEALFAQSKRAVICFDTERIRPFHTEVGLVARTAGVF